MFGRILLITVFVAALSSAAAAFDSDLGTYFEFGRRGSSGLVDEEDLTDEFNYSRYNAKFSHKMRDDASYYVKYQYYQKNFDTLQNLNNNFQRAGLGFDTPLYANGDLSFRMGPDFEFKAKSYKNSTDLDYNQFKGDLPLTLKKEKDWTVKLTGGINAYQYPNAVTDQFKLNSKVEFSKKLFHEALEISAFYKFQHIVREKLPNRSENTVGASADLETGADPLKNIEAGFEHGMDNTIIYEEREDSYDFKYDKWYLKTSHVVSDRVKSEVKYTGLARNYSGFSHDYGGFMLANGWDLRVFHINDYKADIKFDYMHKQFRYPYTSNPYSLYCDMLYEEMTVAKTSDWKANLIFETKFYRFPAKRMNDKIYYIARIGLEKYLLRKSLIVGFDYRYTFKNFLHKLDIIEDVFRFRADWRF
jgi:hypothetical protein